MQGPFEAQCLESVRASANGAETAWPQRVSALVAAPITASAVDHRTDDQLVVAAFRLIVAHDRRHLARPSES